MDYPKNGDQTATETATKRRRNADETPTKRRRVRRESTSQAVSWTRYADRYADLREFISFFMLDSANGRVRRDAPTYGFYDV